MQRWAVQPTAIDAADEFADSGHDFRVGAQQPASPPSRVTRDRPNPNLGVSWLEPSTKFNRN